MLDRKGSNDDDDEEYCNKIKWLPKNLVMHLKNT